MNEELLQYIWKYKLCTIRHANLKTVSGEPVSLVSTGIHNTESGPDFENAKIKINNILWAGCVELHVKSSDWEKHNHHQDNAYSNVILHVVYEHDKVVYTNKGYAVPTLELKPLIRPQLITDYKMYMESTQDIVCRNQFGSMDAFRLFSWLDRLLVERLERKVAQTEQMLKRKVQHKEEVFYHCLATAFGFKTNALPFSLLAESLPLSCLAKQKDNLMQAEAMFFGQADLLPSDEEEADDYALMLKEEYHFLQHKFSLQALCSSSMWKFAGMYPSGFPTIRIAQFAALLHRSTSLLSEVMESEQTTNLSALFSVTASEYWDSHYRFGVPSSRPIRKTLGKSAVDSLIINTVLPFLYAYAQW
ncbi:MAG: DUF2851 family protein, partial [Bacteroidales bacterium]|nr:DUF2851 family protein [Bacteroidales bacterium]